MGPWARKHTGSWGPGADLATGEYLLAEGGGRYARVARRGQAGRIAGGVRAGTGGGAGGAGGRVRAGGGGVGGGGGDAGGIEGAVVGGGGEGVQALLPEQAKGAGEVAGAADQDEG